MELAYFDRVDENDKLVGGTASYDEVHGEGLWHRGVHVILYTPDKEIVVQKRSPSLKYHPNEVEISVGGGVDAGEIPERAILREVREELGMSLTEKDLHFLGKTKFNHRTKTQNNRVFIYSYSACVPKQKMQFRLNEDESSAAFLISERKLRQALKVHRIKNVGRISSLYAYWTHLLNSI